MLSIIKFIILLYLFVFYYCSIAWFEDKKKYIFLYLFHNYYFKLLFIFRLKYYNASTVDKIIFSLRRILFSYF